MNTSVWSFLQDSLPGSQVAYWGSEVVVVVNPGLQTDDCEADAVTTAYLNINMVEVARTCVGYPSCNHLVKAYWYFTSHYQMLLLAE